MRKKLSILILSLITTSVVLAFPALSLAQEETASVPGLKKLQDNLTIFGGATGLPSSADDAESGIINVIVNIINIALGFLGVIAVIMIIYAGFKWMMAGGNEQAVTDARKYIKNAVIGIAIILMSYIFVNFVVMNLIDATSGGSRGLDSGEAIAVEGACWTSSSGGGSTCSVTIRSSCSGTWSRGVDCVGTPL
jgi:hypothetical protein